VQLVAVGVSHNSAAVGLRERLTVTNDSLADVLRELREHVAEALVLSTCNRVELYAVCGHEATGADVLRRFLAAHGNVPVRDVRDASYAFGHEAAARHLLRVAAGLDSMVVGENEILGQVRRALAAARAAGATGPVLDRLGDSALACGKRVRTSTALGRDGESIASVAVRTIARDRGGLDGAHVLIVGAGETAQSVADALARLANIRVTVVNRTQRRAIELASRIGGDARPWSELATVLTNADVVIGCTGSTSPVVDRELVARARAGATTPLLCVDLGVPRAVDHGIRGFPGVRLIDLDRVQAEIEAERAERERDVARAESIVERETERYMAWWQGRSVASTITRLHAEADRIRGAEIERAFARLPELDPRQRAVVADLAARLVAKLLRAPVVALKHDPEGANMAAVVERLFELPHSPDLASEHPALGDSATLQNVQPGWKAS
jgi:glutamyl-tRNA reductase